MKQLFIASAACEDSLYPFIHNIIKKVSKYCQTWCWGLCTSADETLPVDTAQSNQEMSFWGANAVWKNRFSPILKMSKPFNSKHNGIPGHNSRSSVFQYWPPSGEI